MSTSIYKDENQIIQVTHSVGPYYKLLTVKLRNDGTWTRIRPIKNGVSFN